MQVVIDTKQCPCRTLNDECGISNNECYENDICSTCPLIRNGGVKLPEHHGRIIDESKINQVYAYKEESIYNNLKVIHIGITHTDAPTIIEGGN